MNRRSVLVTAATAVLFGAAAVPAAATSGPATRPCRPGAPVCRTQPAAGAPAASGQRIVKHGR